MTNTVLIKPFGFVWTKPNHAPQFFWIEQHALNIQRDFGGDVVAVFK
jgi:hypothetical protein